MTLNNGKLTWAPKVSKSKIGRLYHADAKGLIDEELINEVGWALWSRCDSIRTATAAHYGQVRCPACGEVISHAGKWAEGDRIECTACAFQLEWSIYHQSYRAKQLFGANAMPFFTSYLEAFPKARAPEEKMLLIDQLIHAFHIGLTEIGRPVGANLIEGSLKDVIRFLDALTNNGVSATGISDSRPNWRRTLDSAAWTKIFIEPEA